MAFGWQDQQPYGNLPGILSQIGWDDPNKMDPRNLPQGLLAAAQSPDMPAMGSQDAGPAPMQAPPMPPPRPPDIGTPMPLQGAQPPTQEGMPGGPMPMAQPPAAGQQQPAAEPGFGERLAKAFGGLSNIYGAGLPGDKLIELGAAIAHPRGAAVGLQELAANNQRTGALKQAQQLQALTLQQKQAQLIGGASLIKKAFPSMSDQEAVAAAANPAMMAEATKRLNPSEAYTTETDADGNTWQINKMNGQKQLLDKADKPQFGVIGKDEFGTEKYGFIDSRANTLTPAPAIASPPPSAAPAAAAGPGAAGIPAAPVGVNPKVWRDTQTRQLAEQGKLTESQGKATQFGNRMEEAEGAMKGLEGQGTGIWNRAADSVPLVGNLAVTEPFQKYRQAERQWVTALLRRESGAAIGASEYDAYSKQFFPQPGDTPDVIKQKAESRRVATDAMKKEAGPSYQSPSMPQQQAPKRLKYNPATGALE